MTILDRYLTRRLLFTLFKLMLSLVLLFVIIDLVTHRQDNISKYDIPLHIVAWYYLNMIPTILFQYQFAAMALLVSALMVLGRAAQDNEITAFMSGGVGLRRIARAPVALALLLAIAAFAADDTMGVRAANNYRQTQREYFSWFDNTSRGGVSWTNLSGGWTCHILKFNREALTGQDVYLHSIREDLVQEIRAHRIWWDAPHRQWQLEDGRWFTLYPGQDMTQNVDRITQIPAPFSEAPETLFALDDPPETKSASTLARDLEQAESLGIPVQAHWVDYHAKFARPALCFVMIWLAIPFAIRLRRGGFMIGFGVSIAIALAYLLLFYMGLGLGHLGKLPPFAAAWLANAAFLVFGLVLFYRTPT
jgi:LPS export ABC transporter permease LptG